MCYDNRTSLEKPNREIAWLVVEACIFYSDSVAIKDCRYINEVNSMLANIGLTFVFVPLEFHRIVVTICSYVKDAMALQGHDGKHQSKRC